MTIDNRAQAVPGAHPDEVHVWHASLNPAEQRLETLRSLLCEDEHRRMERFRFDVHRRRYAAGRGMLRWLLGGYLGTPPRDVALSYGAEGKPGLLREAGTRSPDVRFNISHSADEALFAVTLGRDVGVDIERVKEDIDCVEIAKRFFSEREVECLLGLPEAVRPAAFFECWTRKESFIKACGGGLRLPLDGFDVAVGPDSAAALLRVQWDSSAVERWTMAALDVPEGFRGAVTVEGRGWALRQFASPTYD